MEEKKQPLTTAEEQRTKNLSRLRIFVALVIFDALLVGYLIFEMIMIFKK